MGFSIDNRALRSATRMINNRSLKLVDRILSSHRLVCTNAQIDSPYPRPKTAHEALRSPPEALSRGVRKSSGAKLRMSQRFYYACALMQ
jgi:hypothetical protein